MVLSTIPPAAREAIAFEWWYRAWAERESTLRYRRLTSALRAAGLPDALVAACARAEDDERRHADLCADVARGFDALDPFADRPLEPGPLGPAGLSPIDRLIYEMVAFGCVTETLNSALLLSIAEEATHETVRDATRALLVDEVQHGKLGWACLAWSVTHRGPATWLSPFVSTMVAAAASKNLTDDDVFCARWSAPELGYLARARRVAIFDQTVRNVIGPGLTMHGVDGAAAVSWLDRQSWAPNGGG